MEVYAAQIDRMDQGIGRILEALEATGQTDNTMIVFLSDNGGCAEDIPQGVEPRQLVEDLRIAQYQTRDGKPVHIGNDPAVMPGAEDTYQSYGFLGRTCRIRPSGFTSISPMKAGSQRR